MPRTPWAIRRATRWPVLPQMVAYTQFDPSLPAGTHHGHGVIQRRGHGFSTSTCFPARAAASVCVACRAFGEAMNTASTRGSRSSASRSLYAALAPCFWAKAGASLVSAIDGH